MPPCRGGTEQDGSSALPEIFDTNEFQSGLLAGLIALAAALVLGVGWYLWKQRRVAVGGLLFTGAGLFALDRHVELPDELFVGIALLVAGGLISDFFGAPVPVRGALAVPGAWFVGLQTDVSDHSWVEIAVVVTIVVAGTTATDLDRRWRRPSIAMALFAVTVGGVYLTVPDTEAPLALLAPAGLLALVAWPLNRMRMGTAGAYAAIGLLAWVTAFGGIGRNGAIVGGLASVGLLVAEPVARLIAGFRGPLLRRSGPGSAIAIGVGQVALVFATSRVAGLRKAEDDAAIIAGLSFAVALMICVAVAKGVRRNRQSTGVIVGSADTR